MTTLDTQKMAQTLGMSEEALRAKQNDKSVIPEYTSGKDIATLEAINHVEHIKELTTKGSRLEQSCTYWTSTLARDYFTQNPNSSLADFRNMCSNVTEGGPAWAVFNSAWIRKTTEEFEDLKKRKGKLQFHVFLQEMGAILFKSSKKNEQSKHIRSYVRELIKEKMDAIRKGSKISSKSKFDQALSVFHSLVHDVELEHFTLRHCIDFAETRTDVDRLRKDVIREENHPLMQRVLERGVQVSTTIKDVDIYFFKLERGKGRLAALEKKLDLITTLQECKALEYMPSNKEDERLLSKEDERLFESKVKAKRETLLQRALREVICVADVIDILPFTHVTEDIRTEILRKGLSLIKYEADAISLVREMDRADTVWDEYWKVCARIFVDEEHLINLYKTLPPKHPLEHQLLEKISPFFLIEE